MIETLNRSWALLLGMMLLMVGNGIQGTLLGVRGAIEGFSTFEMSLVMSAYFLGFLGGSRYTPDLIRRVGHVRVFAALGSLISAILILYPAVTQPAAWIALRVMTGFCFAGVYVTAESWLNNSATNKTRGIALSLYIVASWARASRSVSRYIVVQMLGIIAAQGLMAVGDPSGFVIFILPSVLVSLAFAPILLSVAPTPSFETAKPMGILRLFRLAPLSCAGVVLLGGAYSALFGMASVYAGEAGLNVGQISSFVAAIYVGGLVLQFPVGAVSDRTDRRLVIMLVAAGGALGAVLGIVSDIFPLLLAAAFVVGGMANPLYGLLLAYANDYLDVDDMASAAGRMVFLYGIGAVGGPVATGWLMDLFGPPGFFVFLAVLLAMIAGYGVYRSFQRPAPSAEETGSFAPVTPTSSAVAVRGAQEYYVETSDDSGGRAAGSDDAAAEEEELEEIPPGAPERAS